VNSILEKKDKVILSAFKKIMDEVVKRAEEKGKVIEMLKIEETSGAHDFEEMQIKLFKKVQEYERT
jgi:hypothetical protein